MLDAYDYAAVVSIRDVEGFVASMISVSKYL